MSVEVLEDGQAAAALMVQTVTDSSKTFAWPAGALHLALADIDGALNDSEGWLGWDGGEFWASLSERASTWFWSGADRVRENIALITGTQIQYVATLDETDAASLLAGFAQDSIEDVAAVGTAAVTAAKSPVVWALAGLVGVGVLVLLVNRR